MQRICSVSYEKKMFKSFFCEDYWKCEKKMLFLHLLFEIAKNGWETIVFRIITAFMYSYWIVLIRQFVLKLSIERVKH